MGIVNRVLTEFMLSTGEKYRIELNDNRVIHVHLDNIRIDMSISEFRQFVKVTLRGRDELRRMKDAL